MKYDSLRALVERAEAEQTAISELVIRDEAAELECSCEEVFERMRRNLQVMRESVVSGMERDVRSTSGLTGGDAWKMSQRLDHNITGRIFVSALTKAIAVS